MCGFCCFGEFERCIALHISLRLSVKYLNLEDCQHLVTTIKSPTYIIVIILQVAANSYLASTIIIRSWRPFTPVHRINRPWSNITASHMIEGILSI